MTPDAPALSQPTAASPLGQTRPGSVDFSIAIPMRDEEGAAQALLEGCIEAARPLGTFEICVTNDGSTDGTAAALRAVQAANPEISITIVEHPRSAGQSAALQSAIHVARGAIICTLDGDGQNPPDQIAKLVPPLLAADGAARLGLVAGVRVNRNDSWARKIASGLANAVRRTLLRDGSDDAGCGLKAFRRDAYLNLPYFNHMHRFFPALFRRDGWEIQQVPVSHRPRSSGQSKYTNFNRALVGISDLLGVAWLIRRRRNLGLGEGTVTRSGPLEE